MMNVAVTMLSFFGVFSLCVAGLFSRKFEDNWLQHVGLIGMGFASFAGVHRVYHMDWVPPEMALFAVATFAYGSGTAFKVWRFSRRYRDRPPTNAHKTLRSKAG